MKPLPILSIAVLLVLSTAFAQEAYDFDVQITPVKDSIYKNETGEFLISIVNYKDITDRFRLDPVLSDEWSFNSQPGYLSGIEVAAHSTRVIRFFVYPNIVTPGQHAVKLQISSEQTKTAVVLYPVVNLRSELLEQRFDKPNIDGVIKVSNNDRVDPRDVASLLISLKNKNLLHLTDLTLRVESGQGLVSILQKGIELAPLEQKEFIFPLDLDAHTLPMADQLTVSWDVSNKSFGPFTHDYEVVGYRLPLERTERLESGFLKKEYVVELRNVGTLESSEEASVPSATANRAFTTTDPDATFTQEDGAASYLFSVTLQPGEVRRLSVKTSYRMSAFIIIVIIVGTALYYLYRSPIVISKRESIMKLSEGGLSELKIILYVKNRGRSHVEHLEVADIIPHIAEIGEAITIGTIKPSSVTKSKKQGTIVRWTISPLERFEERIITYNLKSKLSILGGLMLPPARASFIDAQGKKHVARSAPLRLSIG